MQEHAALTFQRTIDDLKPVDENGNAIAMDNADLTSVKLRNGIGLGGYIPETQFAWYCGQGFIGYQTAAIISQNWLVDKACSMPAKDASRNGYEVSVNDGTEVDAEVLDYIREQDKKFEISRNCVEFIRPWAGVRHPRGTVPGRFQRRTTTTPSPSIPTGYGQAATRASARSTPTGSRRNSEAMLRQIRRLRTSTSRPGGVSTASVSTARIWSSSATATCRTF